MGLAISICWAVCLAGVGWAQSGSQPLQGGIQQNELKGNAQGTGLSGGAQNWSGTAQQGAMGAAAPLQGGAGDWGPLNGSASQQPLSAGAANDPDEGELAIQWDTWRNNLMQAIQDRVLQLINVQNDVNFVYDPRSQMMVSRFGMGCSSWYKIDVLPNRQIVHVRLTQLSRYPQYDQAVVQAINSLQGQALLTYPAGSKRRIVTQEGNVKTAGQSQSQTYQFGDVERQRH